MARSYGDLSENFEYKAAKDMQRVLMARRAELEDMMSRVRPTDFSEAPKGVAGIGSTVVLAHPDGREDRGARRARFAHVCAGGVRPRDGAGARPAGYEDFSRPPRLAPLANGR